MQTLTQWLNQHPTACHEFATPIGTTRRIYPNGSPITGLFNLSDFVVSSNNGPTLILIKREPQPAPTPPQTDRPPTEAEEDAYGLALAKMLGLRKERATGYWRTQWGTKTNKGLFRTLTSIMDDLAAHDTSRLNN